MTRTAEHEGSVEARARSRVGTWLKSKYHLDRVLGIGGMAAVYAATHRNKAELAVKMLHPELSGREDIRNRFVREGYVANSVKHPGAVLVVDDDVTDDGVAFLVMELLQGATLEGLLMKAGRLPPQAVVSVGYDLLDVLAAAHAKSIVHRDIKPANLFVRGDGSLKVLDFGIARLKDLAQSHAAVATQAGSMMGTPAFMAPEQAMAKPSEVGPHTDVWAAGATLFTLLTGRLVHEARTASELLIIAATTPARLLSSVAPSTPPALASVVDRALAFDKAARWPTAQAMRNALREASLASFGTAPVRQSVAVLLAQGPEAFASTAYVTPPVATQPLPNTSRNDPGVDVSPRASTQSPGGAAASGGRTALLDDGALRLTTAKPVVSSDTAVMLPMSRSHVPILLAIGIGSCLLAIGVGAVVVHGRSTEESDGAQAPPVVSGMPAPPTASAVASAAPSTSESASPTGSATASPPPPRVTPVAHPAAITTPPPQAPSATPDCTPPYTLDEHGNRKWKRECFR